jgi:hypothetical protein
MPMKRIQLSETHDSSFRNRNKHIDTEIIELTSAECQTSSSLSNTLKNNTTQNKPLIDHVANNNSNRSQDDGTVKQVTF